MIIFINGSINAGKSTVAKILAKKLPSVALVEIDGLRNMVEWMPMEQAIPINLENAISVIKNFDKRGLNVIVPYPLSRENYDYIIGEFKNLASDIYFFTLAPKLQKALTNRGKRKIKKSEKDRIKYHYEIGIHNPSFGEIIDNSEQTPEETAKIILHGIPDKNQ